MLVGLCIVCHYKLSLVPSQKIDIVRLCSVVAASQVLQLVGKVLAMVTTSPHISGMTTVARITKDKIKLKFKWQFTCNSSANQIKA